MLPTPEVTRFVRWFAAFQHELANVVHAVLRTGVPTEARSSEPTPEAPTGPGVPVPVRIDPSGPIELEWGQWLEARARPELARLRTSTDAARSELEHEHPITRLRSKLTRAVEALPEAVALVAGESGNERARLVDVPLRRAFELGFSAEIDGSFDTLERSLALALADLKHHIDEVERVLDYYAVAVQRHAAETDDAAQAEEFAHTGLARVQALTLDLHRRREGWARRIVATFVEESAGALDDASAPFRAHRPALARRRVDELEREQALARAEPSLRQRLHAGMQRAYGWAWPLALELVSELQAQVAEHDPADAGLARRTLSNRTPAELGRELPPSYRRLFAPLPIEVADMYIHRPAMEDATAGAIEAWRSGMPQAMVLHGDRGSGKRTLVNQVLARMLSQTSVRWIRLGPTLREEPVVAGVLARALRIGGSPASFAALASARSRDGRRRVIVLENAERLLSPSPEGIERMHAFLALVAETAASTLWILLMATPAATLALHRLELASRIPTVLELQPLSPADLRAVIRERHRLSGFELEFSPPSTRLLDRVRNPIAHVLTSHAPEDVFFARLSMLTAGNPRQAMYHWLASTRTHAQREGRIVVSPLPDGMPPLLPGATLSQRLILALLAQHGSLATNELRAALGTEGVEGDVTVLWARGYVTPSRELERHWTLPPLLAHPLLLELRAANMI